jgi:hypothetical protein
MAASVAAALADALLSCVPLVRDEYPESLAPSRGAVR